MEVIRREQDIERISKLLEQFPVVAIRGPRLCGKTTLAKQLDYDHFFDLALGDHAEQLSDPIRALGELKGLIVLDEIHLAPKIFSAIKNIVDSRTDVHFIILGSASFTVSKYASRHLLGRMTFYELGGLTLADVGGENLMKHLFRGGIPGSYLAPTDEASLHWREDYVGQYFSSVFVSEGYGLSSHILNRIWRFIGFSQGSPVNLSLIAHELAISRETAKRYFDALESAQLVRSIYRLTGSGYNRVKTSPKLFFRDSGLLSSLLGIMSSDQMAAHPQAGRVWEAYALETLIRSLNLQPTRVTYWRDKTGNEHDLVWEEGGQLFSIVFNISASLDSTKRLEQTAKQLRLKHLWVVHAGKERSEQGDRITVLPITDMLAVDVLPEREISKVEPVREPRQAERRKKVFISYSHKDGRFVRKLVPTLEKAQIPVTVDWKSLRLGDNIDEFVAKSIRGTETTVLVISKNSLRSPWVMAEFLETLMFEYVEDRKRLLPVYLDRKILDPNLYLEIDSDIQAKIDETNGRIIEALNRNIPISFYGDIRERLLNLKNNLDKALRKIRGALIADFSTEPKLQENLPKLLNELDRQRIDQNDRRET